MSDPSSTPPPPLPPSISTTAMNDDKLSGQLIIKVQLGDDIRKMMIHNEDLTLNELVLMMERVFAGKISNSDEVTIKYLDDDGDKITLLNDSDLTVALHFHNLLRLFVLVNGQEQINCHSADSLQQEGDLIDAKTFQNELQTIRNSVQTILDRLQLASNEAPTEAPAALPSAVTSNATREFDPYKHLNQQPRSATLDNSRVNSNHVANNEHSTAPTDTAQKGLSTDANQAPPSQFQQIPTPHFLPSGYNHEQQAKTNVFGPPPTTFPSMLPLPNTNAPRFPPAITPNSNAPSATFPGGQQATAPPQQAAAPHQQDGFYGQQQATSAPQQSGFYAHQQAANFNPNYGFPSQHASTSNSNSGPATINPSFVQTPPPPMAAQQPYGAYFPQNSYYNPAQQYPKAS